jgi:dolichol-phosphate mannosyltransferase
MISIFTLYCSALDYEIVIVEDNSPDGTLEIAEEMKEMYGEGKIIVLSREGKLGLGSAYMVSHIVTD